MPFNILSKRSIFSLQSRSQADAQHITTMCEPCSGLVTDSVR